MMLRNFPPADQCSSEDLDAIADLVVRDPRASYDLAGSREHIEALCRRYQSLAQDLSDLEREVSVRGGGIQSRDLTIAALVKERDEATRAAAAFERSLAAATNDLDAARQAVAEREDEIARVNNERQAEVNAAADERERADAGEAAAEVFEATARAALAILARRTVDQPVSLAEIVHAVDGRLSRALVRLSQHNAKLSQQVESMALLLDGQRQDRAHNDQLHSAFASAVPAICDGKSLEQVNLELDEELAAHPDVGPLHHARDQRDTDHQERP